MKSRAATTFEDVSQQFPGSLTVIRSLLQELLLSLLFLQSDAVLALQPRLRWMVDISLLVLLKLWEKGGEAGDGSSLALLRRMVTRRHPSESWAWRKKRKKVWRELIGHLVDELKRSLSKKRRGIEGVAMCTIVMIARKLTFTVPVTQELEGAALSCRVA